MEHFQISKLSNDSIIKQLSDAYIAEKETINLLALSASENDKAEIQIKI